MENLIKIGYTKKTYGFKGALKAFVEDPYLNDFLQAKVIFLDIHGRFIPFFVDQIDNTHLLSIKFEDVNSKEEALPLTAQTMLMRAEDLQNIQQEAPSELAQLQQFEGFTIHDQQAGEIGVIEEIIEMPQQFMALLSYRGKEILIPINDAFVQDIDPEKGLLYMDLPDGLLDVF